jgi:hypothetical protein
LAAGQKVVVVETTGAFVRLDSVDDLISPSQLGLTYFIANEALAQSGSD